MSWPIIIFSSDAEQLNTQPYHCLHVISMQCALWIITQPSIRTSMFIPSKQIVSALSVSHHWSHAYAPSHTLYMPDVVNTYEYTVFILREMLCRRILTLPHKLERLEISFFEPGASSEESKRKYGGVREGPFSFVKSVLLPKNVDGTSIRWFVKLSSSIAGKHWKRIRMSGHAK